MNIQIHRYYGDHTVTKSHMTIEGTTFHCETREPTFHNYKETFAGCSRYCLPQGTWKAKTKPSIYSPMTLTLQSCPGHRAAKIIFSDLHQTDTGNIVIGQSDNQDPPETRQIEKSRETFTTFEQLMYRAFANEEEINVTITNP